MPRSRDWLYRFRPASPPGGARDAGVPVDRRVDQATELEAIFRDLVATERACADLVEQAQRQAARVKAHAAEQAKQVVDTARQALPAERSAAAAQVGRQHESEMRSVWEAADREAARVASASAGQASQFVDRVVAAVTDRLEAFEIDPESTAIR